MTRRAFLLTGLAIFTVVLNHTTSWGITAMFWWTDQYRPVTVPNFDQIGSLPYYVLLVVRKLTVFSVPAFLFASGFFIAYAARGNQSALNWKMVRTRIWNLLAPYIIWSGVIFIGDALQGITYTLNEYLVRLVTGEVSPGYYFVPLLCQFYLISPLLVPIARTRPCWLLIGAAVLQLTGVISNYLSLFGWADSFALYIFRQQYLFFIWAFFFALGIVSGLHLQVIKQQLVRYKRILLVSVIVLGTLAIVESDTVFRLTRNDWPSNVFTLWSSLYAVAFILYFLSIDKISDKFSQVLNQLGNRSYGIYLIHGPAMEFIARVIRQVAPGMLARPLFLFQIVVFAFGLGIPLLMMVILAKSPARRSYRYLFG